MPICAARPLLSSIAWNVQEARGGNEGETVVSQIWVEPYYETSVLCGEGKAK